MKKLLIASAATAALAFAAPAFAQVGVSETVQGTVTTQASDPAATVTGEASAEATSPVTTAQTDMQTTAPVPEPNSVASVPAAEVETAAAMTEGADGMAAAEASADTPPDANLSVSAEANIDLPQQVQVAVADGSYTTDDLNRAQLQALQAGAGR